MKIEIEHIEELPKVADQVIAFAGDQKIWLLNGQMGAGKTTLSKSICRAMEVLDTVQSPTFSIVNEYLSAQGETIYHFDFYRLEHPEEALSIGVEEYFYSGNLCLIEWAEKIGNLLPEQYLAIDIVDLGDQKRHYTLTHHG